MVICKHDMLIVIVVGTVDNVDIAGETLHLVMTVRIPPGYRACYRLEAMDSLWIDMGQFFHSFIHKNWCFET